RLRGPRRVRVEGTFQFQDNLAFEGEEGSHPADVPLPDNDALEGLSPHMAAPAPSRQGFVIQHQLPSAGSVLAPHELERALQCVSSFLTVLCDDLSDDVLPRALAKLPQRAAAYGAFADGCAKPSVVQAYSAAYTALSETQSKDSERCINLLLDLVRQDLSDPVLLKAQVMSLRLGDVGEGGRAETPTALHQRLSPQLISLAKEGSVSKLEALGIYFTALDAHSRHVLHTQAAQFMRRSKEGFLRAATPADDSVEAALLRASAASTQVFNELVGLLKLEQSTARPLGSTSKTVNTGDLVAKVQGGDVMAVRTAQRVVKQLSTALQPAPTLPVHTPARPGLQWCDHHKRMVSHSTAECRLAVAAPASRPVPAAPRPLPSAAALPDSHSSLPAMDAATHAQWQQFQQFLAMQASHSHAAAAPVLRAHTAAPRPRCLHCGKEGHNEDRCFIKHPELRPTQWGPTRTMALATVPEEEISHSFSGCLAGSVGFTDQGSSQPAHAHAAAADRPLSFTPGSATVPRIPARAPEPAEQPCLASLAAAVATISTQLAELKQLSLITTEHVAQLQAQMPLALAVKASASPSMAASSTLPCIVGPDLKPNLPYALPFAANPSVAAGLSLADQHGTHHAVPGVMLDSGSAATMLTTTLTQQLQLHLMPCQQRIIQSGGVAFQVLGAVMVEVGLGVGGTHPARSRHRALVVADTPSLPYNALIGTDVFYKHGVQLDLPGRLLSYAPRLASHREPQPRHTIPLFFEFPATSSTELLSLSAAPIWACAALPEPASDGGADSGSGHTSASYLRAPGVAPMATSATPGCSHAHSVAEDQPGAEVRGLPPAPRSKPGRGMDRPQLPTRTPKHQRLGAAAARRRSKREPSTLSYRQQLAAMFSKGISVRALCHTLLLLLCTLVHGTLPNALPPATSLFSGSTISSTLPDGQQHLPHDVRFTKHAKGMLFGNHPGMLATQRVALQSLVALPTLVATPGSYAFRSDGPGLMLKSDGTTSEPTVGERERALGYGTGATAAARVTHAQRFAILGRCMDAYAMQSLLAVAHALHHPPTAAVLAQLPPSPASCACMLGGSSDTLTTEHATPVGNAASPACLAAALNAAAEETSDIHADTAKLHLLRTGAHQSGLSATELRRVLRRAKAYRWEEDQLRRVMADGSTKLVPPPAARDELITAVHGSNGHFGVRRTTAMLLYSYWWPGVHSDVARVLKSCHVCDRARASFNLRAAQLSPLPVAGLFYRWGVDLAGPLPRTHRGNEYLMVCIEHLTKHVELVPIPDRLASTTAYHFNHQVLGRFGASAEVVTDGGREFKGEFADLLLRNPIDHRVTSPHHPQADGLAERAVQTFKEALRKHIAVAGDPAAWDEALPAIALGYRVSPQQATRCSPYSLLYGRAPVLSRPVVRFDDPALTAASLLQRSAVLSRETAVAMGNIRIAQHRDTLRYALTHSGSYKPAARQLHPGMFVWTQRPQSSTLQLSARPEIFRVVSVGSNGVARLMGRCGRVMAENVCNLAPCHLPDIDPTIDHTLARPAADFPCSICKSPADADRLLLCDGCGTGYHTFCLTPPLAAVPEGTWLCPACHAKGISAQHVQQRTEAVTQQPTPTPLREVFTAKQGRDRAASAQQLHGRVVYQPANKLWGVVRFRGQQFHPHYFAVDWVDGTVTDAVSPTVLRNRGWLQPEGTVLYATPTAQHPVPALLPNVAGHVPRRSSRTGRARDTSQGDVAPPT
ncbi:hypothetical protein QJQ45_014633, partial [Haematococcus lacustris]